MVVNNPRPCKRLKRRVTAELFDLRGFPPPGFADLYGPAPFRTSIRSFLSRFVGSPQTPASLLPSPNLRAWQIVFQVGGGEIEGGAAAVTLNVVEEDVSLSRSVYCDHCRVVALHRSRLRLSVTSTNRVKTRVLAVLILFVIVQARAADGGFELGWLGVQFCRRAYSLRNLESQGGAHILCVTLVITSSFEQTAVPWMGIRKHVRGVDHASLLSIQGKVSSSPFFLAGLIQDCQSQLFHSLVIFRCKSCRHQITANDLEDWAYLQLDNPTHLLHGVVHSNGYGHLLRVNGREGGSKLLSGCEILDFWDRLCNMLRVRKVSVMDVSKKYGLEFRLLNAVAKGRPWYGNWGYEFGAGSFAISIDSYFQAVRAISSIPLEPFLVEERSRRTSLYDIISFYSSLSTSPLSTLQDLVLYIMTLVHEARSPTALKKPVGTELSRWRADDLSQIESALMKVLLVATTSSWVSYKSLGGAISRARDPELVDFCLKHLPGRTVGDKVVCSQFNPATKTLEYRLQARDIVLGKSDSCVTAVPSEEHLLHDLRYVYQSLVHPQTMMNYRPLETRALAMDSARKLLDCKQFVKSFEEEYRKEQHCNPFITTLLCKVELIDQPEGFISPPPELINLPKSATLSDLKLEITKSFRDVYIFFRQFQVEELPDFRHIDDSSQLSLHCSSFKTPIVARGRCPVNRSFFQFIMERGTDSWTVDCQCGAQDDDGERMLACDVCGVWQHTRCVGIPDFEEEPAKFVCKKCGGCHKRGLGGSCKQTARPRAKLEGLSISKVR
ncbi:PHD finger protein [Nymphaea thermarum]|nr:PHD finger protein [Nymphaea thermarum]